MGKARATWYHNKWLALVGAIWICTASGLTYVFSLFSSALKSSSHYSQHQVNLIGTASDMGGNVGLICGLVSAYLPDWAMLTIGAIMNLLGYGMVWLTASGRIEPLPFWQVCAFMAIGVNGSTFFNTVALVTCVRNFPRSRGVVVGFLKGVVGLSGAIYSQVYAALVAPDDLGFLLVLALGPTCSALLVALVLRPAPEEDVETEGDEDDKFLNAMFGVAVVLAAYLMSDILISTVHEFTKFERRMVFGSMLALLACPLAIPLWIHVARPRAVECNNEEEEQSASRKGAQLTGKQSHQLDMHRPAAEHEDPEDPDDLRSPLLPPGEDRAVTPGKQLLGSPEKDKTASESATSFPANSPASHSLSTDDDLPPGVGRPGQSPSGAGPGPPAKEAAPARGALPDLSVPQSLRQLNLWLLVLSMTCGVGSALTVMDNLAQIGAAQGHPDVAIPVALVSIWNFAGRVGGGLYTERLVRKYALPRPAVIGAAQGLMAIGHLLFAFAVPGSLYAGSLVVGTGLGVTYGMVTASASELFGLTSFGMVYNVITTAIPAGSYLFSGVLAGYVYDREAEAEAEHGLGSRPTPFFASMAKLAQKLVGENAARKTWGGNLALGGSPPAMAGSSRGVQALGPHEALGHGTGVSRVLAAVAEMQGGVDLHGGGSTAGSTGAAFQFWSALFPGSSPSHGLACTGVRCFRITFIAMAMVCLLGMLANFLLAHRTRGLYKRLQRHLTGA